MHPVIEFIELAFGVGSVPRPPCSFALLPVSLLAFRELLSGFLPFSPSFYLNSPSIAAYTLESLVRL